MRKSMWAVPILGALLALSGCNGDNPSAGSIEIPPAAKANPPDAAAPAADAKTAPVPESLGRKGGLE